MRGNGSSKHSVADLVDELLTASKSLSGIPIWTNGNRQEELRFSWPVLIEDELHGCYVAATAYPDSRETRFTISLVFRGICIWRVDYEHEHKRHTNPADRIVALGCAVVAGRGFHAWSDNRHLATFAGLPKEMKCARPLPENIRGWENTFRWFCGETRIAQPPKFPDWPTMTRLGL
jgi:hypothetical protein